MDATRDGVAVVSNRAIVRQRDRAREQIVPTQQPLRQDVLVVEWLVLGLAPQMKQLPRQMSSTNRWVLKKITFPALSMIEPSWVMYVIAIRGSR
jgi:hypothetical protein